MSTTGRLQVRFTADQAAWVALLQHEARVSRAYQSLRRRNAWNAAAWGLLIAAALGAWAYARAGGGEAALSRGVQTAVVFGLFWTVFAAAFLTPVGFYRLMDGVIRRRVERGMVDGEFGPYMITLVDEGIVCDGVSSSRLALWREVERISIEDDAVYIDLANGTVFRVPREAFRGDVEFRRFVEYGCARAGRDEA